MTAWTRLPLTARYALLPALAVVALTVVLLALAQWLVVDELSRRSVARAQTRAASLALHLESALQASVREIRMLARSPHVVVPQSPAAVRAELEFVRAQSPHVVWLGLVTPTGDVLAGTRGWLEGRSIAERPVYRESRAHTWVGDAHPAVALEPQMRAAGQPLRELIDIGEPVRDAQGRLAGVLAAHVGIEWVDQARRVAEGRDSPTVSVFVIDGRGRSLLAPLPPGVPPRLDGAGEVTALDGHRYFGASQDLGTDPGGASLPWRVVVLLDRDSALAPAQDVMRSMAALGALAALACALVGYTLARRALRPWHPMFDSVLARLGDRPSPESLADGVDGIARELERGDAPASAPGAPEALLARLARDARDFKRIIDHLPVGVAVIDPDFCVQYLNPGYTRLLQWTTDQVRGRLAAEFLFDAVDRAEFSRLFDQLGDPPGEVVSRFDARTPNGTRVAVQWHLVPLIGTHGRLDGAIVIVHDIRPERAARARAEALDGRLRALADAAVDDLLATLDADGRVLEWSPGAERLTGLRAADAIGQAFDRLLLRGPALGDWLLQARRDGRCPVAAELVTADGRLRWFEGSAYALGLAPGSARFGLILRDQTAAREVRHALERSEERLRLALDGAGMGTWDIDLTGGHGPRTTWSAGYAAHFGVDPTQLPQTAAEIYALLHPDDRAAFRAVFVGALKDRIPIQAEFRIQGRNGLRWHAIYGRALHDDTGRAYRVAGVGMDITARKEAEAALSEGRRRLDHIVETMAEGLVMIDADGRYTLINPAAERTIGVPASELIGHRFDSVRFRRKRPEGLDLPIHEHAFVRLRAGSPPIQGELIALESPDGRLTILAHNGRALRHPDGRFAGAVLTYVDVTERYRAEQALLDSEARLSAIIASASDAVVSTDLEGRITLFNPAAERIFGRSASSVQGQPLDTLIPERVRAGHAAHVARFVASGVAHRPMGNGRVEAHHADGSRILLEASIAQASVRGQTVLTAILRDVTERAAHERALEASRVELGELTQRLLAQEKQTTRRLAQALHDEIGQTLTALRLHWDALMAAEGPLTAQQRARVDALVTAANRQLRGVLGELRPPLLDEAGLPAALDNEVRQQGPTDGPPDIRLEIPTHLQAQRWPADVEYAAFMVAREAVTNALQHARAHHIVVTLEGDDGELRLTVRDDGVGLAEEAQAGRPGHLGVVGMRERALAIRARLSIAGGAGCGTVITLEWTPADEPDLPD